MIQVYGIKNCDSVKKALKFFKAHDIAYELCDFKASPVGCEKVSSWLSHVEMKTLLNSRGTTYRTLKMKELDLDDASKKQYLCDHNMLIKRPVVEYQNRVLVGFNLSEYEGVFL
ncbi:MAG: Spx/MgsR family RNA polymerase-binding regulatory protein [Campylobacterota bacterium]|nr:Spx/MgsR family RNA polymerase-binding regulatory protein [Campylobacterota bacterium]